MKIVHTGVLDKFIPPFVKYIEAEFNQEDHSFFFFLDQKKAKVSADMDRIFINGFSSFAKFILELYKSDKIILHSMFSKQVFLLLLIQPWLLKKCYWIIWGGDLYFKTLRRPSLLTNTLEFFRSLVLRKIPNVVTPVYGDYLLAQKWYNPHYRLFTAIVYESNLFKEQPATHAHTTINILLGNSAAVSNNHFQLFDIILPLINDNVRLYVPLSYGDQSYAKKVITEGRKLFDDKFIPMTEFMPFSEYLSFLQSIDIAVLGHDRQQGLGNAITLLGYGKKLYLKKNVTTWDSLASLNLKVFDLDDLNLTTNFPEAENNKTLIKENFNKSKLKLDLKLIFNDNGASKTNV